MKLTKPKGGVQVMPEAKQQIAEGLLYTIKIQSSAGVSANGDILGIDWRSSGKLMDTARINTEYMIEFPVDYAEYVNDKYAFAGVSPQFQGEFDNIVKPLLDNGLEFIKE